MDCCLMCPKDPKSPYSADEVAALREKWPGVVRFLQDGQCQFLDRCHGDPPDERETQGLTATPTIMVRVERLARGR